MGSTAFGRSVFAAIAVNFVFCSAVGAQVQPIRINCGGPNFTGTDGVTWQADRYYVSGGNLYTSDLVQGTPDLMLYRAGRYSLYTDFYYQIPVANGSYRVKLKFAEIQYYTVGSRLFHVDLNGTRVLTNFDIVQQAGAARFATDREFTANVTNGQIRLDFIGVFRRGLINAIEITSLGVVGPSMSVAPSALSFAATAGGTNPAAQGINVAITGGSLNWTASANQPWLAIAPASGSASAVAAVSVNIAALAAGAHTGAVTFTANGVSQTVNITLNLAAPPSLSVAPAALSYNANLGGANPAAQPLTVTVTSPPVAWTASSNQSWLTVSPASGSTSATLTASVNIASLGAGTHTGAISVNSSLGLRTVPVTLNITSLPSLSLSPGAMTFTGAAGGTNPSPQQAAITVANGSANWTAASSQPWLLVSPASGSASGVITVSVNAASLAAGTHNGAITVTAPGAGGSPAVVNVTLTLTSPPGSAQPIRINSGGPDYTGPAGTFLSDRNFSGGGNYYTSDGILGTGDLQLYRSARYGVYTDFYYQVPIANGSYRVKLKFAEIQFWTVGSRRFHVDANGTRVLPNFDIVQQAGAARTAVDREFVVDVTGGQIRLDFIGVTGRGLVNAIEITPLAAAVSSMSVAPAGLAFSGSGTQQVAVGITNGPLSWTAAANQPWLSVTPAAGTASGNVAVAVNAASLAPGTHTGAVTFNANGSTQTVDVTVNIATLSVAPGSLTFNGSGTQQATVTVTNGPLSWTAAANQPWLSVTPAAGTASGNVAVAVNAASLAPGTHTGAVTFTANGSTQTVNVTVNIATLSVAPGSLTFNGSGTQQATVTVTNGPLSWTAAANQPWLSVTPAAGTASGNVAVAVNAAALAPGTHTGAVTITANGSTQTVNVTVNITAFSVAPASLTFSGSGTQQVAITSSFDWTAAANQPWLSVTPAAGTASGNVAVAVNAASLAPGTHTGAVTVTANGSTQTVNVTVNIATLSVAPGSLTFSGSGTQQATVTVTNGPLSWTAAANQPWLSVTPAAGTASGNVAVAVNAAALAPGTHTGAVTITANGSTQTVNVTVNITAFSVAPASLTFSGSGTQQVAITSSFSWTAAANQPWLSVTPAAGSASGNVAVAVNAASLAPGTHTGAVTFNANGSTQTVNVTVNITAFSVAPASLTFSGSGTQQVAITSSFDWTAAANQPWLSVTPAAGTASGNVAVAVNAASLAPGTHTGAITVTANGSTQTVNVTVNITAFSVAPASLTFSGSGTQQVAITSSFDWTAAANQPWLSVTPAAGSASGNVAVAVNAASLAPGTHTGAVTVTANGSTQTVNVTVNITAFSVAPASLTFSGSGTQQVAITSSFDWTAAANQPWLSVTPAAGTASGNVAVAVNAASLAPGTHTAAITFNANGASQTVTVTLNLSTLTVAPGSLTFIGPTGGPQPAPKGATVFLSGAPTTWTAQTSQPWLQVSPASGTAAAEVLISAITTGLAAGVYTGAVNFSAPGAAGSPGVLGVTLHVAPQLSATPGGLAYFATAGGAAPASQTFLVQPTAANVPWTIVKQRPWVTISPVAGVGPATVTVSVDHSGLTQGIYNDVIVVSASDNTNAPANVFLSLNVSPAQSGPRDFYVSPTGLPGNDGSLGAPWDLVTALGHPQAVRPGDRIWVRGGIYGNGQNTFFNRLAGSPGSPIVLRNYPGERATINGHMQVGCCDGNPDPSQGANVWVWGLEFMNTNPDRTGCSAGPPCWGATPSRPGVDVWAPGARLINNIIHDTTQGVGWWKESTDSELYGNLIYYNGYQAPDRAHGHGVYSQNGTGLKKLLDNILFDQFGFGMHLYGSSASLVRNYLIEGNISFNNGAISTNSHVTDNLLVAGGAGDAGGITVRNNHLYYVPERDLGRSELGFAFSVQNQDLIATNNHFIGGYESAALWRWQSVTFTGNTVYARTWTKVGLDTGTVPFSNYLWDNNTYYGASNFRINGLWREYSIWRSTSGFDANSVNNQSDPTGVWVFARPNAYETGRGHVVIYNWAAQSQVMADLSAILTPGTAFEIRDAQNFFAAPVAAGVYTGGSVAIPLTGLSAAAPVGTVPTAPIHPGPRFATFVVLPQGTAPILR